MKKTLLLSLLFILFPLIAHAATCDAGYYLVDGVCTDCSNSYYCPGDDIAHECPAVPSYTYSEKVDLVYGPYNVISVGDVQGTTTWITAGYNVKSINQCAMMLRDIVVEEGVIHTQIYRYSSDTNSYSIYHGTYWIQANVGYYLSEPHHSGYLWFSVKPCTNTIPANSHYSGPGTPDSVDGTIVDANDCPWECDDGYGLTDTGACEELCTAGITTFNSSTGMRLNVYAAPGTEHALRVMVGDTVCYVNSATGYGTNTVHIDYNGTVYHLIN